MPSLPPIRYARDCDGSLIEVTLDPRVASSAERKINDVNTVVDAITVRARVGFIGTNFSACFAGLNEPASGKARA